ncbi:protein of unknown function [Agrobacterium pusense]|uniref:Uncharacterized protein n=1 Tax=Agrobacterium pusense TaxID=648995 RepID=U4Q1E2_9HYPH|nr:protein of unknown function [Agrobacterium pusense]
MRKQRIGLEHHRRAAPGGRQIGHDGVAKPDIAAGNALVTSDHPERRGLAAARRAEQAAVAPRRYLQAYRMDGGGVAVNLGYGSDVNCGGFAHKHSPATLLSMQEACQSAFSLMQKDIFEGEKHRAGRVPKFTAIVFDAMEKLYAILATN